MRALLAVVLLLWQAGCSGPVEAPAAEVKRASLVQLLTTNGKVEPLESWAVHARAASLVVRVEAREGDAVRQGQRLAAVDDTEASQELARARAQLETARAEQGLIERGGSAAEMAELESALARSRLEQSAAEREIGVLERLVSKQAATRFDLEEQQRRLQKARQEITALERKRRSLLGPEDRLRLEGRIREAEAAVARAEAALGRMEIRAPASGILYELRLRAGALFPAGELVARIGRLDKVRVRLLVDEPELGRVQAGQLVRLSWDALPGRTWEGRVERLPARIETIGNRNIGDVLCTVDNPESRLAPNVTVHVEIQTGTAENALTIPRAAVVREGGQTLVLHLDTSGALTKRPVRLGIQDPTRVQVIEGLAERALVLLPGERVFRPGEKVQARPVM